MNNHNDKNTRPTSGDGKKQNIAPERRVKAVKDTRHKTSKPSAAKPQAPVLSPKEKAILAEQRRLEKIRRNKAIRSFIGKFSAVMIFALIGAGIALGLIFGIIFLNFNSEDDIPDEVVRVTLFDKTETVLSEGEYFYRNGQYYVSLNRMAELCSLTMHGDVKNISVSFPDGSSASFTTGSNLADVSGMKCVLTGSTIFEFEKFYIPVSFFADHCYGITSVFMENGSKSGYNLTLEKSYGLKNSEAKKVYPSAIDKERTDITPVKKDEYPRTPSFRSNLSAYEEYMNPANRDEYLILINADNMLDKDYVPGDLIDIVDTRKDGRATQKMRLYAAKALEALFIEMRANGFTDVSVTSGYRSYATQENSFRREIELLGGNVEKAKMQVAVPGSSEHQSGLCIDMHNLPAASNSFKNQDAFKWIYSNCADFGFILRFPEGKTDITKIIYEPWHYRYVGRYHAQKIMDSGLCLEEYMASLS